MIVTAHDIARIFGEPDTTRGRVYQTQGRVQYLRVENEGSLICARVQGTDQHPYEVEIHVKKRNGKFEIQADCSCPVGYMCKHAAATLFEVVAQENRRRENIPSSRQHSTIKATGKTTSATTLSGALSLWAKDFTDPNQLAEKDSTTGKEEQFRLVYLLNTVGMGRTAQLTLAPALAYPLKNSKWSKPKAQTFAQILNFDTYRSFMTPDDHAVFRLALSGVSPHANLTSQSDPDIVDLLFRRALATGRAYFESLSSMPLIQGPEIQGTLVWDLMSDGKQRPSIEAERQGLNVIYTASPWYFDPETSETGPLRLPLSFEKTQRFLEAPPITKQEVILLRRKLQEIGAKIPAPFLVAEGKKRPSEPVACLRVVANNAFASTGSENSESSNDLARLTSEAIAYLTFDYNGASVNPSDPSTQYAAREGEEILLYPRDKKREAAFLKECETCGLIALATDAASKKGQPFIPKDTALQWFWLDFLHITAPLLREKGFKISIDKGFMAEVLEPDDEDIAASFTQSGEWWFSLELGINVNGKKMELLPILVGLLRNLKSVDDIATLTPDQKCYAPLPDGRYIALPAQRVKTILQTLVELAGEKPLDDDGQLKISMDLATAFSRLEAITSRRWIGEAKMLELIERLGRFEGIKDYPLPKNLHAELRPYQKQGYNWLRFLSDYGLGGILADDMGLGKTVQTLAYIQALKEEGCLKKPIFVIMPTSLVGNWQAEAARFTPQLKLLTLHGKNRAGDFAKIAKADVVLSTYPLLSRDIESLREQKWQLVILDEAQAIKNPTAKMTQAACALDAAQRLCLTGTPVENHLGEAWSLFTFLMPGLLGDHRRFTRLYRNPIELQGDEDRQKVLAMRLKPFILRRLKTDVAKELPPKTEIIQRVTLSDEQRDLYETVRNIMNEKVREELSAKGFARSQIVILDALLKLRQVCCDPRLVKLTAAHKVKESAKLEELMEMLPTLIEDGRKILLFSQFTSMLDLIKPELEKTGIPFVELRGTTKDRRTPIEQFQNGDVPLFLISLKAGGTGLNLTAADTVIHFDPWWNPSVENQATDRAHRIGQDKPVFVYKMIAEGTVEERIVELQARKAQLAGALFGDNPASAANLTQEDLQWLLEPSEKG